MIKANCTWGEGPDVMVVLEEHPFILYEEPQHQQPPRGDYINGFVAKGSFDLTVDEAKALAIGLNEAARQAENQLQEYEDETGRLVSVDVELQEKEE